MGCPVEGEWPFYAAWDRRLECRGAVKLVPVAAAEAETRHRFAREARSAAGLTHRNAVAVCDAGEADGHLYLVMEFVDGRTLADVLAERGPLGTAEAAAIATSALAALGHTHAVGIVDRDVKLSNIMVSNDDTVKLLDFGIARRFDDLAAAVPRRAPRSSTEPSPSGRQHNHLRQDSPRLRLH